MSNINDIKNRLVSERPLIHCITNPISINQCANTVLAVGGRPVMIEHPLEVEEVTRTAGALLVNLGNITDARISSSRIAAAAAREAGIPVVLDAVGAACSKLRRELALEIIAKDKPAVIKGNYSEVYALFREGYRASGVDADAALSMEEAEASAVRLARDTGCVVMASGKTDIVTDGDTLYHINNGTPRLGSVTGTGCMLGALCAAYASVSPAIDAAVLSCATLGICGELAEGAKGPGSFMVALMDALGTAGAAEIERYMKVEVKKVEEA